jgi:hypothetical protein
MTAEEIKKDAENYIDPYGLITPNGGPSGNGLLYTSEWLVALKLKDEISEQDIHKFGKAIRSCRVAGYPALYNRNPSHPDREAPDDYIGLAAVSSICGYHFIHQIVDWGNQTNWTYNNLNPEEFHIKSWFGRMPQVICHFKFAAGKSPSVLEKIWWCGTIILSGLRPVKDNNGRCLSWLLVETAKGKSWLCDLVGQWFMDKLNKDYPGGMSQVFTEYFTFPHPIARILNDKD